MAQTSDSGIPNSSIPEKPSLDGIEAKWQQHWDAEGTYRFDRSKTREEVFSIDTPPPTASGSLHVGHVYSYTQADVLARFQRMTGKEVFYPMGWDDNGLPTERRVQNYYAVNCDPSVAYDPDFVSPEPVMKKGERRAVSISRPNFVELCLDLVREDEKHFEALFRRLGLSVDWNISYSTIDPNAQRASQRAFLRNLERSEVYQAEAPTMWDVDFQTAVAQAEIEDREAQAAFHRLAFHYGDEVVTIDTTRPELLPACIGIAVHPDDEKYKHLHGQHLATPLFGARVPVVAHELADPEKGTGAVMVCTFGDQNDVIWWRTFNWPTRTIVQRDGRLGELNWAGIPCTDVSIAESSYAQLQGLKVRAAQDKIVEMLRESGELIGEPRRITHAVKFYERGDKPLEIVSSRQWFIKTRAIAEQLVQRGHELRWHPPFMQARYEDWINGLNSDWLVSRQRYFGVPFPVWYALNENGDPNYQALLLPAEDQLPIDPSTDTPSGYTEGQRNQPNGFTGDPDVMDTWATSSLTPQIATGWVDDEDLHSRTYPMDMRPQGHDIIRTWLFSTVVRAQHETGHLPWRRATLSGWILDPDRKKMSKSKGNVVTPMALLEEHGTDAVRYWAASARLGVDTAWDTNQMKVGRRLSIKLLNASKFVLSFPSPVDDARPTEPIDLALLARLRGAVTETTRAFEAFDYARSLELTESFFWSFCDDYLELVKGRAYGAQGVVKASSANVTLRIALDTMQRLFAPFLAFTTEEVWSWWKPGSVHRASWPTVAELPVSSTDDSVLIAAAAALGDVRRAKSDAKVSMKTVANQVTVTNNAATIALLRQADDDITTAGVITRLDFVEGEPAVSVTLAD